ncbi:hypothetical protein TNCV_774681 [Trichonephila clavipes]|nr:hypothetical protein TNCV_774681 [Trichonephila clavipes]
MVDFHKRILFSDEAHFWLNGYVNKQNCRIWSEANPQVYVETPLHPEKLTVWCALWAVAETKISHMELSRDCKGVRDHWGVALDQEVGNDEGCVAGGIVMVELDRVFNVSRHARDPAFQSPEHLQVKG